MLERLVDRDGHSFYIWANGGPPTAVRQGESARPRRRKGGSTWPASFALVDLGVPRGARKNWIRPSRESARGIVLCRLHLHRRGDRPYNRPSGVTRRRDRRRCPRASGSRMSIKACISVTRNGAFAPFVRPTPQSDPWRHDRARIVS